MPSEFPRIEVFVWKIRSIETLPPSFKTNDDGRSIVLGQMLNSRSGETRNYFAIFMMRPKLKKDEASPQTRIVAHKKGG